MPVRKFILSHIYCHLCQIAFTDLTNAVKEKGQGEEEQVQHNEQMSATATSG